MLELVARKVEAVRARWSDGGSEVGSAVGLSGLVAGAVACGAALAQRLAEGWSPRATLAYCALALLYLGLTQLYRLPLIPARWLLGELWLYLLVMGVICLALQVLSHDPYLQPMAFTVPLVYAALVYPPRRSLAVVGFYLLLMALGLWLGDVYAPQGIILPVVGYGTMMVALVGFTRLSVDQADARRQADALAADLARQRDELARLVDENARLHEEARRSATLSERNRLARELHDTIAQGLTAVTMQLDAAQRSFDRDPERSRARVARAHELARATLNDVRASVWMLAEPLVDGAGLGASLADLTGRFAQRTGIAARYRHQGAPPSLDHAAATQLLRIVQEALHNAEKHAQAATVEVGSQVDAGQTRVWVRDDGVGFDQTTQQPGGGGFGLHSLRERARLAGGQLCIESTPGQGTTVLVTIEGADGAAERKRGPQ